MGQPIEEQADVSNSSERVFGGGGVQSECACFYKQELRCQRLTSRHQQRLPIVDDMKVVLWFETVWHNGSVQSPPQL